MKNRIVKLLRILQIKLNQWAIHQLEVPRCARRALMLM
jgi:hypothetical protein